MIVVMAVGPGEDSLQGPEVLEHGALPLGGVRSADSGLLRVGSSWADRSSSWGSSHQCWRPGGPRHPRPGDPRPPRHN